LPPRADMCRATMDVCYGPKAHIGVISSQARLGVIYRRLRRAAAPPTVPLFLFQRETAGLMLLLLCGWCRSSRRLRRLISASVFHIEKTVLRLVRHLCPRISANYSRGVRR